MKRYPTDVTDAEWATIQPFLDVRARTGRPPTVDRRAVLNALLYMNRTGAQWRMLPHDFPNWTTIRYYFDQWTHNGAWQQINDVLRREVRQQLGRDPEPQTAVLDSQTVKTTEAGGERGVDGGKKDQRSEAPNPR